MPRVLLVDDDIAEISAVKRVLARAGHQSVLATNATDALGALSRSAPALVLVGASCDNGDAVRTFAEAQSARAVPLLVLGETSSPPDGAVQIPRPIDPDQLATQIASVLGAAPAAPREPAPRRAAASQRPARGARTSAPAASASRRAMAPAAAPASADGAPKTAALRKAAAEALRARAAELRRTHGAAPSRGPSTPRSDERRPEPSPALAPANDPSSVADPDRDPGLEEILRRAEEAERAHAAEKKARARQADRAIVEAHQRAEAEQIAIEKAARARAAEERALKEERARAEAERRAQQDAEARARAEEERRAVEEQARRRTAEEARRAQHAKRRATEEKRRAQEAKRLAEEQARQAEEEKRRALEAKRLADEEARRAEEEKRQALEAKRRAEEEARRAAERAEQKSRAEEEKRRAAEEKNRAEEEERRADEEKRRAAQVRRAERDARAELEGELDRLRRDAAEDARKREADEEELRAAIASARAEMDSLRRRGEEEARRRAEAEAEIARLAKEAEMARLAPFDFPIYEPPGGEPPPDPAPRSRVAALREAPPSAAPPSPDPEPPAPEPPAPRVAHPPPAELRSGTLSQLPIPRVLALAARAEVTGRIDFKGDVSRSLYLEEGRIVGASSADPAERLEELALRFGLVTRDQHRLVATAAAPLATRRAALMLVERGFLKQSELTGLVRRRTEEVVFGIFGDLAARFRWAPAEVPPDERTTLERTTLQLALEGVRRRWRAPQLEPVLGGDATLLAPAARGPDASHLGLSPEEERVLALADGLRTLDEVIAASPLDALSTCQALAALVLVGALSVRTFGGGRPASAATAAIDIARVREKLDQVRRADYFTILGVGRLCTPHEVRDSYERLQAEFDPARLQGIREEGLDLRLEEIRRVLGDARDVLADERLRDEYLRGLGE